MNEVLRQEKKFLISLTKYYQYAPYLGQLMKEDKHNESDGYLIRSLYFDTLEDKDYQEKEDGIELRRKIRLRNYGPLSDFAILEMKQKQGMMQKKRSLRMNKSEAQQLIRGNYSVLLQYSDDFAVECYYLMNTLCYRPKTIVEYHRKAFVAQENNIRVTFDSKIKCTESNFNLFSPNLLYHPVMHDNFVVLEVKYNGFLLSYIKDILKECNESELSVSKYCMGRSISKHYRY